MSSELASMDMDYFHTRSRAYSKPTIEELRMLEYLKLQFQCQLPLTPDQYSYTQHGDPRQVMFCDLTQFKPGLLTPIDTPEDSEMSGTENVEPRIQPQHQQSRLQPSFATTTSSLTAQTPPEPPSHMVVFQRRPTKRKHLADRDDNIPSSQWQSARPSQFPAPAPKRPRHDLHHHHQHDHTPPPPRPATANPPPDPNPTCLNCGRPIAPSSNRHNCIYHPGAWISATHPETSHWSCCSSPLTSCGCLISQHRITLQPADPVVAVDPTAPANANQSSSSSSSSDGTPYMYSQFATMYRCGALGLGSGLGMDAGHVGALT